MSFRTIKNAAVTLAATLAVGFAQEAPKAAQTADKQPAAPQAEPPKPKFNPADVLALIPEDLAEVTIDGKVEKVSSAELKNALKAQLQMMALQGAPDPKEQLLKALPRMAEEAALQKVLPLAAAKAGFKADPAKIAAELEKLKAQLKMLKEQQFKNDDKLYANFLKQQGGANTEEEFLNKMKERIAMEMPLRDYTQHIENSVVVTDDEIKADFEAHPELKKFYTCYHILAAAGNPREGKEATKEELEAALKKINEVQAKLKAGEKFEDLAKQYSDCPSKEKGGELGEYNPDTKIPDGEMVPEFTKGFNALKPGEITAEPVKSQFGYHLIKASEIKEHTLEELKDSIADKLKRQKLQKAIPELIEKIKKDYQTKVLVK